MNAKKYVAAVIVLNVVLLAFAASFWQTKHEVDASHHTPLVGPSGRFGPMIEITLPAGENENGTAILNFESGRALLLRPFDVNSRAETITAGIRSNGLDISSTIWSDGAACVTYDMTVVAATEGKGWDETTEQEIMVQAELAEARHAPRRLLVLGSESPDTYLFRTGEGTLGMLQIIGISRNGKGVDVRYKLINPGHEEDNSLASH